MKFFSLLFSLYILQSCETTPKPSVDYRSAEPGTFVMAGDSKIDLYSGTIKVGSNLKEIALKNGFNFPDGVAIVNIVPSIDTRVCEEQTHILGEDKTILPGIVRITVSRDLPMAQSRFADAAKLTNITYFSDYKSGKFGKDIGMLMKEKELLARAVIVTDKDGVVRYLHMTQDITRLPDMKKAIEVANALYTGTSVK